MSISNQRASRHQLYFKLRRRSSGHMHALFRHILIKQGNGIHDLWHMQLHMHILCESYILNDAHHLNTYGYKNVPRLHVHTRIDSRRHCCRRRHTHHTHTQQHTIATHTQCICIHVFVPYTLYPIPLQPCMYLYLHTRYVHVPRVFLDKQFMVKLDQR